MSILAGILVRRSADRLKADDVDQLTRSLSRHSDDEPIVFQTDRVCLTKIDIGAYGSPAHHAEPDGSASMLVGEPLLAGDDDPDRTRRDDLGQLHAELRRGRVDALRGARGFFAVAHYDPSSETLALATDRLGVRLLYYWADDEYIVFATSLRVIESLQLVPKQMDLRGVTELACLGFPLADRTPYVGVRALRAGEIVRFTAQATSQSQYWRWDEIAPRERHEDIVLKEAYEHFAAAVRRRLRRDTVTVSLLSGGLDSRCIVGMLRSLNINVHTFMFAAPRTKDFAFASEIAHRLGTMHEQRGVESAGHEQWLSLVADAWKGSTARLTWPPQRPQLLWSGDGGSVGLGHVYLNPERVRLLRGNERTRAIEGYLAQYYSPVLRRVMDPDLYEVLKDVPHRGVEEELDDVRSEDPARRFYLYLMHNDQRRHLVEYLENIDVHRFELHEPFFDSDLLACIMSGPTDLYIGHRFYTKWLQLFPPVVTSVPWQTYPDHEPCPLPHPTDLETPWTRGRRPVAWETERKRRLIAQASAMRADAKFAEKFARRPYLHIAMGLYRTGLRDYSYVVDWANVYHRYWTRCNGRYVLPRN